MIDPIAVDRHRAFGAEMAANHFEQFPAATFTAADVLVLMSEAMAPTAADHGYGARALEPLARAAAAAFLRRWRQLARTKIN